MALFLRKASTYARHKKLDGLSVKLAEIFDQGKTSGSDVFLFAAIGFIGDGALQSSAFEKRYKDAFAKILS